jgi:hypothetical protein
MSRSPPASIGSDAAASLRSYALAAAFNLSRANQVATELVATPNLLMGLVEWANTGSAQESTYVMGVLTNVAAFSPASLVPTSHDDASRGDEGGGEGGSSSMGGSIEEALDSKAAFKAAAAALHEAKTMAAKLIAERC